MLRRKRRKPSKTIIDVPEPRCDWILQSLYRKMVTSMLRISLASLSQSQLALTESIVFHYLQRGERGRKFDVCYCIIYNTEVEAVCCDVYFYGIYDSHELLHTCSSPILITVPDGVGRRRNFCNREEIRLIR